MQSTSKRKRGDEYLDSTMEGSNSLSLSALGGGGPSGSASGSFLGSSSLGTTSGIKSCNVPSHSRLESIIKQTELLRRMDADAHSVLRAEATEIREKLEIQVSALEAQLAAVKARGISISSSSSSSSSAQGPPEVSVNDEIDLTADSEPEDSSSNQGAGGGSDAGLRSDLARSREEVTELKRLLAHERRMNADEKASHHRALAAADAALLKATTSTSSSSSSSSHLTAASFVHPSQSVTFDSSTGGNVSSGSELAEARESLRASQRRERALAEELKRLQQQHTSSTILTEKLSESQRKLAIAEKEAASASTLRSNLSSAMAALAQWDSTVWGVLAQNEKIQLPPPSGGDDTSSLSASLTTSSLTLISDSTSHSLQVREAVVELQSAHRMLLATVSEQKARLEAASRGRDALSERQMSLVRENSKLIASVASAISERDAAKRETLNLSSHCERLKALIKHYETDGKAGTITRQAVQAIDEQAKILAKAVVELNSSTVLSSTQQVGQGGRGAGRQNVSNTNVTAQLASLQKSLQETAQFAANSLRASDESTDALKARCDVLERSAADLQAQLVAALEATSKLNLVPSLVADAALEGQRLAEEECAQLEQELKALYVLSTPKIGGGGGINKNNSSQETFADGTSTSSYRVLHLISNPMSTALREADAKQRQMLDALKVEAKSLREQLAAELRKVASSSIALRAMQSQLASADREKSELQKLISDRRENASATPIPSSSLIMQQPSQLMVQQPSQVNAVAMAAESAVAASASTPAPVAAVQTVDFEKYKTQLLKMVREKMDKFKDAVKVLTGWQIGITDTERTGTGGTLNRFTLTSIYAEAEHDTIVLVQEVTADAVAGSIQLVSSPYADRLPADKLTVLRLTNSVPAFLAAITSDAVERSTVG